MYHKGLTREAVVEKAADMISRGGMSNFSLHRLAAELEIKTASLYRHVSGLEDVLNEVGIRALQLQRNAQLCAIEGKTGDDAVFALADAYRRFALENGELYRLIMSMQSAGDTLAGEARIIPEVVMRVLEPYGLTPREAMHWQRILRSVMHGFISHEEAGYFTHYPAEKETTYRMAIRCFLDGLKAEIARRPEQ